MPHDGAGQMIEWLRDAGHDPQIELSGRVLPIELNRHPRAKRLTLRLAPDGSAVRITLPRWCSSKEAIAFAAIRKEWLEAQLAKVPDNEDPIARGTIRYRGGNLAIDWREKGPRKPRIEDDVLLLGGARESLLKRLQRWLESEATAIMEQDLTDFCKAAELDVAQLKLTRAKRRWGSCTNKGVVRVNWRLVQAPDFVRRSVVAHEVTHLVHFDHSPAFHAMLGRIYDGDIAKADGWLREHGRSLYADYG